MLGAGVLEAVRRTNGFKLHSLLDTLRNQHHCIYQAYCDLCCCYIGRTYFNTATNVKKHKMEDPVIITVVTFDFLLDAHPRRTTMSFGYTS